MDKTATEKLLAEKAAERKEILNDTPKLEIFDMEDASATKMLETDISELDISEVVDEYEDMLEELYFARNAPHKFQYKTAKEIPAYNDFVKDLFGEKPLWKTGAWVYYPWSKKLIHFLPKEFHNELRTARNKNLITHEEQEKFRKFRVGIAGLSIGQSVAYTLAVNGGCETMHLADMDVIAATNTNRIRASFDAVGLNKSIYISRLIYEINPYAKLKLFVDGLTKENSNDFFEGIDAVVDEVDHFPTKLMIREKAKKRKIPLLMAADVADSVMLEIERYDTNPKQEFFNGKLDESDLKLIQSESFDTTSMARVFFKIHGGENTPQRMKESGELIGKKLAGPPQLGSTAFLSGIAVSYLIRKISNEEKISSSSFEFGLEKTSGEDFSANSNLA
jgi:hypothetical protein